MDTLASPRFAVRMFSRAFMRKRVVAFQIFRSALFIFMLTQIILNVKDISNLWL